MSVGGRYMKMEQVPVFRSSHDNGRTFDPVIKLTNTTSVRD